jgi:hypothetical protein
MCFHARLRSAGQSLVRIVRDTPGYAVGSRPSPIGPRSGGANLIVPLTDQQRPALQFGQARSRPNRLQRSLDRLALRTSLRPPRATLGIEPLRARYPCWD